MWHCAWKDVEPRLLCHLKIVSSNIWLSGFCVPFSCNFDVLVHDPTHIPWTLNVRFELEKTSMNFIGHRGPSKVFLLVVSWIYGRPLNILLPLPLPSLKENYRNCLFILKNFCFSSITKQTLLHCSFLMLWSWPWLT